MCDEMERSLHDALCVVKRVLESKSVVTGGGAVEAALSIYLENYATSMVSGVQLALNTDGVATPRSTSRLRALSSLLLAGCRAPGNSWPLPSSPAPFSSSPRHWL